MKTTGILSALLFAHVAFAQATDSTSVVVSTTDSSSVDAATSTSSVSATSADVSSSPSSSPSGTKTGGTKSASSDPDASAPASTSTSAHNSAPTGTGSNNWDDGTQTLSSNDGNPLIPDGISQACSTFLSKTNSDTTISGCLTPLLNAVSAFTSSGSGSASAVTKALNNLCSSNACSSSMLRSKLTDFKDACGAELTGSNPNDIVIRDYDTMYALSPFKAAICAKNPSNQAYCVLNTSTNGNSKRGAALSSDVLYARDHLTNAY
ncbi:hypothetical protein FRC06_006925, partial [Ceratobasidium sp. 370]